MHYIVSDSHNQYTLAITNKNPILTDTFSSTTQLLIRKNLVVLEIS